jgi:hypothetical protein
MPQGAVFNLATFEEPPVGNLAEFLNSPAFQQRLDEMYAAGAPLMQGQDWWNLYGSSLERVYGRDRIPQLAATSNAAPPVHNLRAGSEYMRRLITGEPLIQPEFRNPETAVGSRPGFMGGIKPGDFNAPGTQMPIEQSRVQNLRRIAGGQLPTVDPMRAAAAATRAEQLQLDKQNDMYYALLGYDVPVMDRRWAKIAKDWPQGIYVAGTKDKVPPGIGKAQVSNYALIENAVRTGAPRYGMPVSRFSAIVWEGIGETIKKTGQLFGMTHPAQSIPESSQGFAAIVDRMVAEKAKAWGITVAEMERRLRAGDAELLTALLSTLAGYAAYQLWTQADPATGSAPARLDQSQ